MSTDLTVAITRDGDNLTAAVNGVAVPIVDYLIEPDEESGAPLVRLTIQPGSLTIGERPEGAAATPAGRLAPKKHNVWGTPGPDPRENWPGWRDSSLAEQVAANAEVRS